MRRTVILCLHESRYHFGSIIALVLGMGSIIEREIAAVVMDQKVGSADAVSYRVIERLLAIRGSKLDERKTKVQNILALRSIFFVVFFFSTRNRTVHFLSTLKYKYFNLLYF